MNQEPNYKKLRIAVFGGVLIVALLFAAQVGVSIIKRPKATTPAAQKTPAVVLPPAQQTNDPDTDTTATEKSLIFTESNLTSALNEGNTSTLLINVKIESDKVTVSLIAQGNNINVTMLPDAASGQLKLGTLTTSGYSSATEELKKSLAQGLVDSVNAKIKELTNAKNVKSLELKTGQIKVVYE